MPHQAFRAAEVEGGRDPITFDFGMYAEEHFTVMSKPSLGDCFELADVPEPTEESMLDCARTLARFIEGMLVPADRPRWNAVLKTIPSDQAHLVVDCAAYIVEKMTPFPTVPPASSLRGRRTPGMNGKRSTAGKGRSTK